MLMFFALILPALADSATLEDQLNILPPGSVGPIVASEIINPDTPTITRADEPNNPWTTAGPVSTKTPTIQDTVEETAPVNTIAAAEHPPTEASQDIPEDPPEDMAEEFQRYDDGLQDGRLLAEKTWSKNWPPINYSKAVSEAYVKGAVSGLLPIVGPIVAITKSNTGPVDIDELLIPSGTDEYQSGFESGYTNCVRDRRKQAIGTGGAITTGALLYVLIFSMSL